MPMHASCAAASARCRSSMFGAASPEPGGRTCFAAEELAQRARRQRAQAADAQLAACEKHAKKQAPLRNRYARRTNPRSPAPARAERALEVSTAAEHRDSAAGFPRQPAQGLGTHQVHGPELAVDRRHNKVGAKRDGLQARVSAATSACLPKVPAHHHHASVAASGRRGEGT